ncbi:MAG: FGGY-family carbohydrate kinase [Actinomycetota bacterium]|nr:FGGY-family carbohydrate kinase [Actinomycetota bacterium]
MAETTDLDTLRERYVLGIDLGTGGPKVAIVSGSGEVVDSEARPNTIDVLADGGVQQSPAQWWSTVSDAARTLVARGAVPASAIVAVACTGQWSGTVAVDAAGQPLMDCITWMDSRGSAPIAKRVGGLVPVDGYGLTKALRWIRIAGGAPGLSGKDPVAHILFIRQSHPDVYEATATFLEPVDYLNLRLTGRRSASYDSITLHWVTDNRRIDRVDYHPTLLRLAGLDRAKLPDLVPPAQVIGNVLPDVAAEIGLSPDTVVVTAMGDVHSAAIGSGAVAPYACHLYIGTSSWLTCHVPFKRASIANGIATIPSAIPGRYMVADEQETAGGCLTFLANGMFLADDELAARGDDAGDAGATSATPATFAAFDAMAARVPAGANGVVFTPWLNGERTPVDDHLTRASFTNLSLGTSRADLVRAVYEGVALNSRWMLGAVEKLVRKPSGPINFVGGGAKADVWAQILADVLARPIRQMADPIHAGVRGAALMAVVALCGRPIEDVAGTVKVRRTFEPDPANRALYDQRYGHFLRYYRRTKSIHAALNKQADPGSRA